MALQAKQSTIVPFSLLLLLLIYLFGCLSQNLKPCFFLLLGIDNVTPFLQIKMGLMMGQINLSRLTKQKKKILTKIFCQCSETYRSCGKLKVDR
jgi:hypothetical protein